VPLFWRLFLANATALLAAFLILAFGPFTLSSPPANREVGILVIGLAALLLINAAVVGESLAGVPAMLEALGSDLDAPAATPRRSAPEIARLVAAYNSKLERLEAERTATARAAVRAQEEERSRLARDLHDEVGQNLTFLLLRLRGASRLAPLELQPDLDAVADAARTTLEQVRTLSRQLRPGVLSDLGLKPALAALVDEVRRLGVKAALDFPEWIDADAERDLVIYRVVQEALTNVLKHAEAASVRVSVATRAGALAVEIADDGNGQAGSEGIGTGSMRERVLLIGGTFRRVGVPKRGTTVSVTVPINVSRADDEPPTRPIPSITVFPPSPWQTARPPTDGTP
jgi:two-component system, NarL family, sensor histidine kinase UhpB